MLSARDVAGFVGELVRRVDLDMIRRHARVDDDSAIASVWPNMRAAPEIGSPAHFAEKVAAGQTS
jgi:hypothetical protein